MAADGLPTSELAIIADVVVTWTSTVAVQAAFLGRPVVYFSPPEGFDTHLVESGGALLADETSLDRVLAEVLSEPANADTRRATLVDAGYVVDADVVMAEMSLAVLGRGG
jgi:predicted glycosyltransferase